ncbi:MAG: 16S rRNA (guanine(527)-N(7))-methyltransferase RsmG [Planctomycetes bacterium]|nr:16S rRNA (guanine(527)-N(7))-methyltransferase RsmG [Planctomycetota bacterium]MCB9903974.1 16S rRNA (guanine(527)-N(7))-methyltransferase RsmG [Planctomycetota bacterium]
MIEEDDDPDTDGEDEYDEDYSAEVLEDAALDEDDDSDDGEDEDDEDSDDSDDEDGLGSSKGKTRKEKAAEEEPPGPDVPAPTVKKMLAALEWAFQDEPDVPDGLLKRYAEHAVMVLDHNRKVNLTAILDPKEVAAKHYLDSYRVTRLFSLLGRRVVDMGCGGGFPGVPIAMAEPNCSMMFVDSTKKKVDFVEESIDKLAVKNAHSHWGRVEDYLARERCDVVVVRAVSSVRENVRTLRKVRHSLKDLIMLKGSSWSREVRAAEREAERLGFHLDTVLEHQLPEELGARAVLVYRAPGGQGL